MIKPIVVIKIGGEIIQETANFKMLVKELVKLKQANHLVIVHGAGPQINAMEKKLGVIPNIQAGRRITDQHTIETVKMVMVGKVNIEMVSELKTHGLLSIGLSGVDGGLLKVCQRAPAPIDYGLVGDILSVHPDLIFTLLEQGYTPVISPMAADEKGIIYNINADTAAARIALALNADKWLVLTNTEGVYDASGKTLSHLTRGGAAQLIQEGAITQGMLPKIEAILAAIQAGLKAVHILNGLKPDTLSAIHSHGTLMTNDSYQIEASKYLMNTYARYPITLIKGEGGFVWDDHGKKYLDFLSGIGCTSLGHCHPEIEKAVMAQMKQLLHTSNLYYSPPNIELAKCLVEHGGLDKVFFCNSGTEANEAAIKLARKYQWRLGHAHKNIILSATNSFHGRTLGALAATAKPDCHQGFSPLPGGFEYHPWEETMQFCNAIHEGVAAVILEPIQGEGGISVALPGFLKAVRARCDQVGALLVFDEVQCGLGRTGQLFAYQYANVKPDMITLAKGIANGLPLGALCATEKVAAAFHPKDHGSTFGGNPVAASAALATLNVLINQAYLSKINKLSHYLFEQLNKLHRQFPAAITSIRGVGLMAGIVLTHHPKEVLHHCQQAGLLVNLTAENVLRLLPPYVIQSSDIDFAIDVIANSLTMTTHLGR